MVAFLIILVVVVASIRAARRRLPYETWHAIHLALYVVLVLALVHHLYEETTFTVSPIAQAYWWLLWVLAIGSVLAFRWVLPVRRNARHHRQGSRAARARHWRGHRPRRPDAYL